MVKIINQPVKGLPTISWARGEPTVIVAHESANNSDKGQVQGEINYMSNNYNNAFYHCIAGEDGFYILHDPSIGGAWGAGPSMHHYAIHVELARSVTQAGFEKGYKNYIEGIKYLANKYNIPLVVNEEKNKKGIYTHHYVTKTFGGTNHTDPDAYFAKFGKTISQFAKDLGDSKGVATESTSKPSSSSPSPTSVVDYLVSKGQDSSYTNRKRLAVRHGIKNYSGTSSQNVSLLNKLKGGSSPKSSTGGKKTIRDIQTKLNRYKVNNISVDGINGPATKKSLIKAYQYESNRQFNSGLSVDGLPGPKTDSAAVTIRHNTSYGNLAHLVQAMLYLQGESLTVDGYWQNGSIKAMKSYQKKNDLTPDGLMGRKTSRKLTRL